MHHVISMVMQIYHAQPINKPCAFCLKLAQSPTCMKNATCMPSFLFSPGSDPGYLFGQDNHHHVVQLEELEEKLQKAASETGTQECPSGPLL